MPSSECHDLFPQATCLRKSLDLRIIEVPRAQRARGVRRLETDLAGVDDTGGKAVKSVEP